MPRQSSHDAGHGGADHHLTQALLALLAFGLSVRIVPFLAFPPEVRRVIYTTNLIESASRPGAEGHPQPRAVQPEWCLACPVVRHAPMVGA
jgi:hypothetical protein